MIVVFGSINLDLVARTERLPQPGETIAGLSFAMLPGGSSLASDKPPLIGMAL